MEDFVIDPPENDYKPSKDSRREALQEIGGIVAASPAYVQTGFRLALQVLGGLATTFLSRRAEAVEREIRVGPFTFVFDEKFKPDEVAKFSWAVFATYEEIEKYVPMTGVKSKTFRVLKENMKNASGEVDHQGSVLRLSPDMEFSTAVHELVHIMRGDRGFYFPFMEEGMTVAISQPVCRKLGVAVGIKDAVVSESLGDGGLEVFPESGLNGYNPLAGLRYYFSGQMWSEKEKKRPGFIAALHKDYFAFLASGGKPDDREGLVRIFNKYFNAHDKVPDIIGYSNKRWGKPLLGVAYVDEQRDDGESKELRIYMIVKDENTAEDKPLSGRKLKIKLINTDNRRSVNMEGVTRADGSFDLLFADDKKNYLSDSVGNARKYRAIVQCDGLREEVEFAL